LARQERSNDILDHTLLITGISQLLTLRGSTARRGASLSKLGIVKDGAVLVRNGRIAAAGTRREVESSSESRNAEKLDVAGRVVLPGFVDSHTHLIHAASRAEEYELKIQGVSYEEIAQKGGGILNSVKKLRAATKDALKHRARAALEAFVSHGTTTVEAKSGYGLDTASELKILTLQKELREGQPLDIVSTFLGAHVVPEEFRRKADGAERYTTMVIEKMLPEQLGVELGAASCDHLEQINSSDISALAGSRTAATLLPGCDFHLGWRNYAPARKLIDAGAIVALATDYNPGTSPTVSMPMILSLACTQLRMTPAEAIAAATINGAYALRREKIVGSIETGKQADLAVFEVEDYREIPYYFGEHRCWMTLKRGEIIYMQD